LVVIGAIAAYWWFARDSAPPLSQTDSAALAPFASEVGDVAAQEPAGDAAEIVSGAEPATGAGELPARETAVASSALPVNATEPVFEEASLLPQVRIELSFSGDCWTDVSDASGRRLFYDLATAGRVVAVSGDEPLQVVLGASENVSITMEGQDYPLPGPARNGGLTRLTIHSQ
jgi:cytoskeleton protein RodZ